MVFLPRRREAVLGKRICIRALSYRRASRINQTTYNRPCIIAKTEVRSPVILDPARRHLGLLAAHSGRVGSLPCVTLLSVLYGVMRHRLDVQAYAAPEATSLAIVVIAGASSGMSKATCMAGQRRPTRLND